jgi:hypothetical protein
MTVIGGFIGENRGIIKNCYSTGWIRDIFSYGNIVTNHGFCALQSSNSQMEDNYWDVNSSYATSTVGGAIGKTTDQMKSQITFTNWNFYSIWSLNSSINQGYPYLFDYETYLTLPVYLTNFCVTTINNRATMIKWTTESESNLLGYHIYRNTKNDLHEATRISASLIIANNFSNSYTYSYNDNELENNSTYYYWLQSIDLNGNVEYYGSVKVTVLDDDNHLPIIPLQTELKSAYPNPFNPSTTISFSIDKPEYIVLSIYNAKGQIVKELVNKHYLEGCHSIVWDGKDENGNNCPSGIYFYKMIAGRFVYMKKMMIIK